MKRFTFLSLLLLGVIAVATFAQPSLEQALSEDDQLLQTMDFQRFGAYFNFMDPNPSSSFTVDIVAQRIDGTSTGTVQIFFKLITSEEGNFEFYGRIIYIAPEELKDDTFLITPDGIFFWNPSVDEPVPVPGTIEVFGDATVAEVVGIGFQGVYDIEAREEITFEDGREGLKLDLKGKSENVAFPFATVRAERLVEGEQEFYRPVTLELFGLDRNDPFHNNTFEEYATNNGLPYFKRQLLDNLITVENQTLLDVTDISTDEIPDEFFDLDMLGEEE